MRRAALRLALCAMLAAANLAPVAALAVLPDEMLADPALEARARALSRDLRCVVCRNQSIDDSNAALARDMRVILRERLVAGDSDEAAVAFLVDRFGSYVLLDPPVRPLTYLLWGGPALLMLATVFGFSRLWRRRARPEPPRLSDEDRALAAALLKDGGRE
ncbi:cytochrome c-type biogenesis protein [Albidovulum sp.]|uniref:cytochrome c-type biogenesis protein n=1 Tax=Albidovulum sp. TaxID=1872424 RepID=UPI001D5202BC|nr:cytochrome c-type biogenesis protein CcmH [Paracoccaceae bacterium]MCC0046106.1 cytochrome c-type biogenesis protein CcmH [Defluviimonas sp.]HPE24481.1 cytochrome c-type biogenesis protein CcmH [Albidovulum sp.]MCB2133169.1 cytochrome c-type biogenesis protein CcmH [Paracoccaceae bacterium]MCB2138386.1 cytochrome c-type biogenesis protein CcmH [Paracoccaceae bacterium]